MADETTYYGPHIVHGHSSTKDMQLWLGQFFSLVEHKIAAAMKQKLTLGCSW